MLPRIDELRREAETALAACRDRTSLDELKVRYLARKGAVAALFEQLKSVPDADKPAAGKALNDLRRTLQELAARKEAELGGAGASTPVLDLTLPGRQTPRGGIHPLTRTLQEIVRIFTRMGFAVADGPEIEDDWHNFGALNFPPDHPARDMQDTFFIADDVLLRTHTSPVQIRVMENSRPPIRAIMPGKVYRNEAVSARSLVMFHQVEGLVVDRNVTFADLKGTLVGFIREFYGSGLKYKFRPTFFPFTEPSADIYITCFICGGKGCRMCKQGGWLEILGCGMVDPNVFRSVGYDPEKVTGYAFGMGIERIAGLKYGIDDLRLLYENDVRFLDQF
jgi:phenylalanyl-tRNA synthetase alpha chain